MASSHSNFNLSVSTRLWMSAHQFHIIDVIQHRWRGHERVKSRTSRCSDSLVHRSVKFLWIFWKWNNVFAAFFPAVRASHLPSGRQIVIYFVSSSNSIILTMLLSHVLLMAKNKKSGGKNRSHLFVDTLNETFFSLLFHEFSWRICNFAGNSLRIKFLVLFERMLASGVAVEREI